MKDFDELKSLWSNQVAHPKVNAEDVMKRIKKNKNLLAGRVLRDVISLLIASVAILWMWIVVDFKMWTTHLALIVILACCFYYLYSQIKSYRRISDDNLIDKPEDYINELKKYKHDRYVLNTVSYRNYIFLLSFGFALYFIEIFFISNLLTLVIGVVFTLSWFAFCYFVLMKRYIRKEESRLNGMIANLERLREQFIREEVA